MDKSVSSDNAKFEENRPNPADFIEYLPWACSQLQVNAVIVINKIVQSEYVSSVATERQKAKHGRSRAKIIPSRTDVSSEDDKSSPHANPAIPLDHVVIQIQAIHDICDNIVHIKFENNKNIPRVLLKIIGLIIRFQTYLTTITIDSGMDKYTLYEIAKFLPSSHLTDICLDNSFIGEANYDVLLEQPNNLKQLSLSRCKIDDTALKTIISKIFYPYPASKTLMILNLSSNRITDEGAKYLGESLRANRQLTYLNLADNMLTDEGADAILNHLIEFRLTWDEVVAARTRHMVYLKEKNVLITKMIKELRASDFEKKITRKKSIRPVSTVKKSKLDKDLSLRSVMDANKSLVNMDIIFMERAETMAETRLGPFNDPFSPENTTAKDGSVYCHGNYRLKYLNLAYNDLSYFTLKKVLAVLLYQRLGMDKKSNGLVNLCIEGNSMPENCRELHQIDDILEAGLSGHKSRLSVVSKRRPQSRSSGK